MESITKTMSPRLMDILISVASFAVLLILIAVLPMFLSGGIAYLTALIIFMIVIGYAGIMMNRKTK